MTQGESRARRLSDRSILHDLLGASHTALGFASLLTTNNDDPEVRRAAAGVVASVRRLVTITEALSLLDRSPGCRHGAEPVSVDAAVRRAVDAHRELFAARGVGLPAELPPSIERITIVSGPVLDQLLSAMLVWGAFRARSGSDARITVACGAAEVVVTLELDARAPADVCMNLAIELAEASGARLQLDAERGAVTLALPSPTVVDEGEPVASAPAGTGVLRILHVDDDPTSRSLVEMAFGANDECAVVAVASIAEALEELDRTPVDVVLVDHRLGDEHGLDLLREIRASNARSPAMFLVTGDQDPAVRSSAEQLGASIVRKPVDIDQLLHAVLSVSAGVSVR